MPEKQRESLCNNIICENKRMQAIKRKTMNILLKSVKIRAMDPANLFMTDAGSCIQIKNIYRKKSISAGAGSS